MGTSKNLADFLKVDKKSLGDFLALFGMERDDLPLLGATEIDIPSFGVKSKVYFLVYEGASGMDYKGFKPEEAATALKGYNSVNYYEGSIGTKLTTGFLLKIGDMNYRPLNDQERGEIEKILESS